MFLKVRHPEAWDSAEAAPVDWGEGIDALRGRKYCLLTTYRRNGEPMPTPVWFGLADGKIYFSTEDAVGKVKRIRNDPRVRIAPATSRGKPLGPPFDGRARILPPEETARADRAIAANYGLGRRLYEGVGHALPVTTVYVEVAAT
jgi:PPOX class probable F420-dependent enzyme